MGRSTTRQRIEKRRPECENCQSWIPAVGAAACGECKKRLNTSCYRKPQKICSGFDKAEMHLYKLSGFVDDSEREVIVNYKSVDDCFNDLRKRYGYFTSVQPL